jgi:hypothetical protein
MTKQLRGLDLKRAQLVPSSVFASPEAVLHHDGLSLGQKLTILRRWEFDARRVDGFGVRGGMRAHDPALLVRVRRALQALTAGAGASRWAGEAWVRAPVADDGAAVPPKVIASRSSDAKL